MALTTKLEPRVSHNEQRQIEKQKSQDQQLNTDQILTPKPHKVKDIDQVTEHANFISKKNPHKIIREIQKKER